jgi:hypothetical protein
MILRFDVEFFGGMIVGIAIALVIAAMLFIPS